MTQKKYDLKKDERYLRLLAKSFPNIADAATEIINLEAIAHLPKGTEHFLADIHGEYQAFQHVLKNASGNIKRKVNELFGERLRNIEKQELCTLIYYPEQKLELVKKEEKDIKDWYHITIHRLIEVCRDVSSKYTRSKVRKSLPDDFSYIIQELLHEHADDKDKTDYVSAIIKTIISTGRADDFIIAICEVIQRLVIDQLHILGDVYDRGPGAHIVMDTLKNYHNWDITWGNHDILWMGACAGNDACICNVIRIALRYANMATIEDGYGINLIQLATFAMDVYGDDPCEEFMPKISKDNPLDERSKTLTAQMHKAISILQFKIESQMISRHPLWKMNDRRLLKAIDYKKGTITLDGKEYKIANNALIGEGKVIKEAFESTGMTNNFFTLIVPDNIVSNLKPIANKININFPKNSNEEERVQKLFNEYRDGVVDSSKYGFVNGYTRARIYEDNNGMTNIVLFIGIYLGVIFLISSTAVLALQQLSEASDSIDRYKSLRRIGVSQKMINKSIFTQVSIYFGLPLVVALVHSVVAIKVVNGFLTMFNRPDIGVSSLVTALIMVIVYGGYFYATYTGYKSTVKNALKQK